MDSRTVYSNYYSCVHKLLPSKLQANIFAVPKPWTIFWEICHHYKVCVNRKFEDCSHEQTTYITNVTLRSATFNRLWATNYVIVFILEWNNWRKGSWDSERPYLQTWQHSHSQSHIKYKHHKQNWKYRNTLGTSVSQNVASPIWIPIKARNYLLLTEQLTVSSNAHNTFPTLIA